jgi:C-terminal processing protease CtpA/Prc
MTRRGDSLDTLARFMRLLPIALAGVVLTLAAAVAQQERPTRSDRTSGRDDSAQTDQQSQQSQQNQFEERRRAAESQDRSGQRTRGQQDQSDQSQYSDRSQRQPTDRYGRQSSDRDQYGQDRQATRGDQSRDQSGRGNQRQQLGLSFERQAQGQSGLIVSDVQQDSAAAQAGLRSGDQIVAVDGRGVSSQQQLFSFLSGQSGRPIPITVYRSGRQINLQLSPQQSQQGSGDVAWLGVFLQDSQSAQGGAQIAQIYPAGPAARAGLRPGDVIVSVNNQRIEGSSDLISTIEAEQPGSRAEVAIIRNNQQMNLPITLGSRDSFAWGGQREDQGGGQSSNNQYGQSSQYGPSGGQFDHFANLPPFAMQLEHERRMYEQHQRIETEIAKLQDEVRQLREAIQQQQRR